MNKHNERGELKPCPFCGAGSTEIVENGKMWTGMKYSEPTSVSVRHWCDKVEGQPSRMLERVGRDWESAVAAWNQRAAMLEAQPLKPLTDDLGERALRGKYGAFLNPFIAFMDAELHANAGKGDRAGWLGMSRETAMLEIYYHLAKLHKAVKNDDLGSIVEHSADVANMSMMLLDICGGLPVAGEEATNGIKEQP